MSIDFSVDVEIKQELKKKLIFGMNSRLPIALILGYLGYRHEVLPIMQVLSHGTRAYIWNANGLPGFVTELDIIDILWDSEKQGKL